MQKRNWLRQEEKEMPKACWPKSKTSHPIQEQIALSKASTTCEMQPRGLVDSPRPKPDKKPRATLLTIAGKGNSKRSVQHSAFVFQLLKASCSFSEGFNGAQGEQTWSGWSIDDRMTPGQRRTRSAWTATLPLTTL